MRALSRSNSNLHAVAQTDLGFRGRARERHACYASYFIGVKEGRKEGWEEGKERLLRAVPKIPGPVLITAYLSHLLVTPRCA